MVLMQLQNCYRDPLPLMDQKFGQRTLLGLYPHCLRKKNPSTTNQTMYCHLISRIFIKKYQSDRIHKKVELNVQSISFKK